MLPYGSDKRADSLSDLCCAMGILIDDDSCHVDGAIDVSALTEEWRPIPQWRGEKTFHPCKKLQAGRAQVQCFQVCR